MGTQGSLIAAGGGHTGSDINAIIAAALSVDGYVEAGEVAWLARQALAVPPHLSVVEVGVWKGRTSAALALARQQVPGAAPSVAVDHFLGSAEHAAQPSVANGTLRQEFDANMRRVGARVNIVASPSELAAALWNYPAPGLVFIDASHTYEDVKRDIHSWARLLAVGGLLAVHDYRLPPPGWPGVTIAVDEFMGNRTILFERFEIVGSMWTGRKAGRA